MPESLTDFDEGATEQSLAAAGAIAYFSSNLFRLSLNANRAPQLKALVMRYQRQATMKLLKVFILIVLGLLMNIPAQAKEWRGIIPLHSTRADVERILGSPWRQPSSEYSLYLIDHASIQITFAGPSDSDAGRCTNAVSPGTVLSIFILPQTDVSLTDLQIDLEHTKVFNVPFAQLEYRAYVDERSGFIVRTLSGKVHEICYLANANVRHRCSRYYRNAKHFGEMRGGDL